MEERQQPDEFTTPFNAVLRNGSVIVEEKGRMGELEQSGYGNREPSGLSLRSFESLYLLYSKKLVLRDENGGEVPFDRLADIAQETSSDSWTKFMIYRDLRSRGYVVREGFGFGTDLRVYERGDYPKKAATYVVFALDEGIEKKLGDLQKSVSEMGKMGKEAIIAVIERRGEVIYYKVSKARF